MIDLFTISLIVGLLTLAYMVYNYANVMYECTSLKADIAKLEDMQRTLRWEATLLEAEMVNTEEDYRYSQKTSMLLSQELILAKQELKELRSTP